MAIPQTPISPDNNSDSLSLETRCLLTAEQRRLILEQKNGIQNEFGL